MTVTPKVAAHFPFLYILSCGHFRIGRFAGWHVCVIHTCVFLF